MPTGSAGNRIIVSGADSGYFELLQGNVRSIRDKPAGAGIALGILDVGLSPAQRRWLELRLPKAGQRVPGQLWAAGLTAIGVLLLLYRES